MNDDLICLEPAYQRYVWGGSRIPTYFKRNLPPGRYAESWEVSDRKEGMSQIANGSFKGRSLADFLILENCKHPFPLLVKIIDSSEHLSVQVHPDEKAALLLGADPKTEMWIALERSVVFAGLKPGIGKQEFEAAFEKKCLEEVLQKFVLEKGEFLFIPAGLIHAIAADSFLLEIQQNSNTTYRLYDWGRKGRELHLGQGFLSVGWGSQQIEKTLPEMLIEDASKSLERLAQNKYFEVNRLTVQGGAVVSLEKGRTWILFCVEGRARVGNVELFPGRTCLIPIHVESLEIKGSCQFVLASAS